MHIFTVLSVSISKTGRANSRVKPSAVIKGPMTPTFALSHVMKVFYRESINDQRQTSRESNLIPESILAFTHA